MTQEEARRRPAAVTTRERILESAVELTTSVGWSGVTMGRVAERVGVSRQTVYNEVGGKDGLAEAMIQAELAAFLAHVDAAFEAHPGDLLAALEAACRGVLEFALDNRLIKAVVSATHGADTELLPLLTTQAGSLLGTAKAVVTAHVTAFDVDLPPVRLEAATDMVVRVVLSHVMEPSGTPAGTAADLAWLAQRVLAPER